MFQNDCSPIHVASQGKPEIVQLLLEHKCDVNVKDNVSIIRAHQMKSANFALVLYNQSNFYRFLGNV